MSSLTQMSTYQRRNCRGRVGVLKDELERGGRGFDPASEDFFPVVKRSYRIDIASLSADEFEVVNCVSECGQSPDHEDASGVHSRFGGVGGLSDGTRRSRSAAGSAAGLNASHFAAERFVRAI